MPSYLTPGVYIEEIPSGSASLSAGLTAVAAFVGFTEKFPTDDPADPQGLRPRLVTSWTQYEALYGSFVQGAMLPLSVYGYFNNGGGLAYIVRVPHVAPSQEPGQLALPAVDRAVGQPLEITSVGAADGLAVTVVSSTEPVEEGEQVPFEITVTKNGAVVETFSDVTLSSVEGAVNGASEHIQVAVKVDVSALEDVALAALKTGTYAIVPAPPEPVEVKPKHFAGSESERTGINGLVIAEEVTMVMVPDLVTAARKEDGSIDLGMWKNVQTALINHCEGVGNRMAVLDAPPGMNPQQIKEWRSDVAMYDSAYAALYYPWIEVDNPTGTGNDLTIMCPPSGHVAGLWSRVDDTRGVWKAPANEIVRGALSVERNITKGEQSLLNPIGINCIRPFGTRGIRVWGARTLSSDSDWTYINVRRLFNMIEDSIMNGTQFAVFEPNDQKLWAGLTRTIGSFLRGLWRDGALFGATPEQAFFVKCDAETNPPDSIDQGKVVVEVGIAPVKPAEFVIFRISQLKAG